MLNYSNIRDFKLGPHFSFFEMTTTENRSLLTHNRSVYHSPYLLSTGCDLVNILLVLFD